MAPDGQTVEEVVATVERVLGEQLATVGDLPVTARVRRSELLAVARRLRECGVPIGGPLPGEERSVTGLEHLAELRARGGVDRG